MDIDFFKKLLSINKDISRITIDLFSIKKLLSTDLSILKLVNDYRIEYDKLLDEFEQYLSRIDNITNAVEVRLKNANDSYSKILKSRIENLLKKYDEVYLIFEGHLENRNKLDSKENIDWIKKVINSINIQYDFKIDVIRIFLLEFVHRIFYPKFQLEVLDTISSKVNINILSKISPDLDLYNLNLGTVEADGFMNLLNESFEIKQDESDYDFYFILSLRHTPNGKIGDFLKVHFDLFDGDFLKFLKYSLSYFSMYLNDKQIELIEEWLSKTNPKSKNVIEINKPKDIKERKQKDGITSLEREETATLFHYLKESKVILSKENLKQKDIAKAILCLTGYSNNTIGRILGQLETEKSKETLEITQRKLRYIITLIDKDLDRLK